MKKLISIIIAVCMVLTMAAAAYAGDPGAGGQGGDPGASAAEQGGGQGGSGGDPGAGGGSGGGGGDKKSSVSATPLTVEDAIIIESAYAPEISERDLTGLYTGETLPESIGDKTVAAGETWKVEDNTVVDKLEIEEGAVIEADVPVIVFFTESSTVKNGDIIGNVQFINDYDEVIAIIHTNDTHGELSAEAYVKGLKSQLIDSGLYSLVLAVNAGDVYAGGNAVAHIYEGEFIVNIMNDIYDFMTWGNNDGGLSNKAIQSYLLSVLGNATGVTTLLANQCASEDIDLEAYASAYEPAVGAELFVSMFPEVLALNEDGTVDWSGLDLAGQSLKAGENAGIDGAIVETANGTKVGLFGESTQGGSLTDAYFTGGMSTVNTAQTMSDALAGKGATAVVGVGHIGWMGPDSTEASTNDTNSAQVAMKTTGIDAIIDAHTHSIINNGEGYMFTGFGNDPIVNQAGCKGGAIGVLYLYLKDGKVVAADSENIVPSEDGTFEGILPDEYVAEEVAQALGKMDEDGYSKIVATSEYFLNGERLSSEDVGGGVRANETNLGDLVADAILATGQKLWTENEIKIALYPGYWVRSSIEAGDITLVDALSVFANPLKIYYAEYTAEELVSKMTTSCAKLGEENNNMFQVAGLVCKYDPATKAVVSLEVAGELIYENGEYKVGEDWTVGCAAEVGGGDIDNCDDAMVFVPSNVDMAKYFCEFLEEADYVIYPDEMCPAGRVIPAE
ncbi:MAG: 5'-nucleotidase C-terminal domain-containing protein [Parasporobacterium sp.]|nr:5'-nucleotidase C-terminal domain-containing protein [Parasporobacterium sp.]